MTKQNYEKPNMEIVVLEDMIKTSGGCDGVGYSCNGDICADYAPCTSYTSPCTGDSGCLDGYIGNNSFMPTVCMAVG